MEMSMTNLITIHKRYELIYEFIVSCLSTYAQQQHNLLGHSDLKMLYTIFRGEGKGGPCRTDSNIGHPQSGIFY